MNLSNIKKVAFIENFNPRQGYPQYGNHTTVETKTVKLNTANITSTREIKEVPNWKRNQVKAVKRAKKAFKSRVGLDYKPTIAVSTKLV